MDSNLKKCLNEIEDPFYYKITKEKALEYFSYPCFSLAAYRKGDGEPYMIFLAYMKFMRVMLPGACVWGIWEEILRKTVLYTPHYSMSSNNFHDFYDMTNPQVIWWVDKVLSTRAMCPNPYLRLELFRLIRIFQADWENYKWHDITETFIYTICEIKPCLLYPSGNEDEVLFGVHDLNYIMIKCCQYGNLKTHISYDIACYFKKSDNNLQFIRERVNNQINDTDSNTLKFILHLIQYIGVFSVMNGSVYNPKLQISTLTVCFKLFKATIYSLSLARCKSTFRIIIKNMPFYEHVAETIRDLTSAVTKLKSFQISTNRKLISIIHEITGYLGYSSGDFSKPCDLPKLLLNRQIQGSINLDWPNSLYLRELRPTYTKEDNLVEDHGDSSEDEVSFFFPSNSDYSDDSSEDEVSFFFPYNSDYSDGSEISSINESNDDSVNIYIGGYDGDN